MCAEERFSTRTSYVASTRSRRCNGNRACHRTHGSRGSKTADSDEFLRAIKIGSTTSFGGKVKPSAPCRLSLWRVKKP
jgi:hypothetical protein